MGVQNYCGTRNKYARKALCSSSAKSSSKIFALLTFFILLNILLLSLFAYSTGAASIGGKIVSTAGEIETSAVTTDTQPLIGGKIVSTSGEIETYGYSIPNGTTIWGKIVSTSGEIETSGISVATNSLGVLSSTHTAPANGTNVTLYSTFTYTTSVSCSGGNCGNITAYLDPVPLNEPKPAWTLALPSTTIFFGFIIGIALIFIAGYSFKTPAKEGTIIIGSVVLLLLTGISITQGITGLVAGELVSTSAGASPFFTSSLNPQNCGNLGIGDSCTNNWLVNATGNAGTGYLFYVIYNSSDQTITSAQTTSITLYIRVHEPNVTSVNLTSNDFNNYTNATLTSSWSVIQYDGDSVINSTQWFRNGTLVASMNNQSVLRPNETKKNEQWFVRVQSTDGGNVSLWKNSSTITTVNTPPAFNETVASIIAFPGNNVSIQFNVSDQDLLEGTDSLLWNVNDSRVSINSTGYLNDTPALSEIGTYLLNVTVRDGVSSASQYITYSIGNDTTPPKVSSFSPTNASTNISVSTNITAIFNESITTASVTTSTFTIEVANTGRQILGTLSAASLNATFIPYVPFAHNTTYRINISGVTDTFSNAMPLYSTTFTTGARDLDGNGIPDADDLDIDGDGVPNSQDTLVGNATEITTNNLVGINVTVNNSANISKSYLGTALVNVLNGSKSIMQFNFTFNNATLDLNNLTIQKNTNSSFGSTLIYNLPRNGFTSKTIYVDVIANTTGICMKDQDVESLTLISDSCKSANETWLACPSINGGYACELNGTQFKISGLNHSAVKESNDTGAPLITSIGTANSGSGIINVILSVKTDENATCRYSTSDIAYASMTNMTVTGGVNHSNSILYTLDASGNYYVRCNDTVGNVMTYSNSTSFSVSFSSSSGSSGGGGGSSSGSSSSSGGSSGGGGGVTLVQNINITNTTINVYNIASCYNCVIPLSLTQGNNTVIRIGDNNLSLSEIAITASRSVPNASLQISAIPVHEIPVSITDREVFQYLKITPMKIGSEDITKATIRFKVPQDLITKENVDKKEVKLVRLVNNEWQDLPTTVESEDERFANFASETPGFSYFAVVLKKISPPTLQQTAVVAVKKAINYTAILVLLVSLLIVVIFVKNVVYSHIVLKKAIKQNILKGYSTNAVRTALIKRGWQNWAVNWAMKSAKKK